MGGLGGYDTGVAATFDVSKVQADLVASFPFDPGEPHLGNFEYVAASDIGTGRALARRKQRSGFETGKAANLSRLRLRSAASPTLRELDSAAIEYFESRDPDAAVRTFDLDTDALAANRVRDIRKAPTVVQPLTANPNARTALADRLDETCH